MYEEFYGFLGRPFSQVADPNCIFLSPQHAQALATVQYSVLTNAGLTLVTGASGMGKTLLLRRAEANLDDSVIWGSIDNTHSDFKSILPWVISAFELRAKMSDEVEMHEALKDFLIESRESNRRVVLVIDEAHNLNRSALEEVRLLMNLNVHEGDGLQIILVGQPQLREILENPNSAMLRQHDLTSLAQRVSIDFSLDPLSWESTDEYITFRLSLFGGQPEIVGYVARAAIYFHSRGIPRLINAICDLALVYGFGESLETIDYKIIRQVLQSKKVSLVHHRREERSQEQHDLQSAILFSHSIDIAKLERR